MTVTTIQETRAATWARMSELMEAATAAGKPMSGEARAEYDRLAQELDGLTGDARRADEHARRAAELNQVAETPVLSPGGVTEARYGVALLPGQHLRDLPEARGGSVEELGAYVRRVLTGTEHRASEGAGSAGGFLVPTPLAAQVFDLARNQTRVIQAGAQIVPMQADTLKQAKVVSDPSPAWRNESAAIASSDITFGQVAFDSRSLAVSVKASLELLEDAPNFGSVLANSLAGAFAVKLDAAALMGSGAAPEPQGVFGAAGVNTVALAANGALPDWDHLIDAAQRVQAKNYEPTAFIHHSRTEAGLAKRQDSTGQYIPPPAYIADIPRLTTSQVPTTQTQGTSNAASSIFAADWTKLAIGLRTEFRLIPLRERYMDTGEIGFVGWLRADVQLIRTDAFQIMTGVL